MSPTVTLASVPPAAADTEHFDLVRAEADADTDVDGPRKPRSQYFARLALSRAARATALRTEERVLHVDLERLRTKACDPWS